MASLKPLGLNILVNNNCLQPEKAMIIADHSAHIDTRERGKPLNQLQVCLLALDNFVVKTIDAQNQITWVDGMLPVNNI